jgi:hypothetical protein
MFERPPTENYFKLLTGAFAVLSRRRKVLLISAAVLLVPFPTTG